MTHYLILKKKILVTHRLALFFTTRTTFVKVTALHEIYVTESIIRLSMSSTSFSMPHGVIHTSRGNNYTYIHEGCSKC